MPQVKRNRGWKRKARVARPTRRISYTPKLFKTIRKQYLGTDTLAAGGSGYTGVYRAATLDQLQNYTELTNLYDMYRIDKIVYEIVYRGSQISVMEASNNNQAGMPCMVWRVNRSGTSNIASSSTGFNAVMEDCKSKTYFFGDNTRKVCRCVVNRPAILTEVYRSAIATSYSPRSGAWIDEATPQVPHYGLEYCLQAPTTGAVIPTFTFDVYCKLYISLKEQH